MHAIARKLSKAQRTRAQILEAAEQRFAEFGFNETRLEDVAHAVGLKRATLFYHFRDKRALYDAVLEDVFGGLLSTMTSIMSRAAPLTERIDAATSTWVDAVASRPAMARLLLRESASAGADGRLRFLERAEPFMILVRRLFEEGAQRGELNPIRPDPFHVISAVVGSTVFYVAALGSLIPSTPFDPLDPAELAAHKRDVTHMARRLLGVGAPRVVRAGPARA